MTTGIEILKLLKKGRLLSRTGGEERPSSGIAEVAKKAAKKGKCSGCKRKSSFMAFGFCPFVLIDML
jgi:hypothetical protein